MKRETVIEKDTKGRNGKLPIQPIVNVPLSENFMRLVIEFRKKENEQVKPKK
jgi:hypothetical protein